jgi:hypothetical protein
VKKGLIERMNGLMDGSSAQQERQGHDIYNVVILTLHVARLGAPRCVYHLPHPHSFNNQASTSLTYKECGLRQYAVAGSTRQLKVAIGSIRQP